MRCGDCTGSSCRWGELFPCREVSMKRRRRDPNDPEVQEAVLQRIKEMTREDWLKLIEELSHAPEGVEDRWPPYDGTGSNSSAPPSPTGSAVTPKHKKKQ